LVHQWSFLLFWLYVFWLLTVFDEWYTVPIVKNSQKTVKTAKKWILVYQSSHVYTESAEYTKSASAIRIHNYTKPFAYQQCCHLANGNKTCPSLLVFKNNNMARESQRFVGRSSRNVCTRVERPVCLISFFRNYNNLPRSGVRAESLRAGSENMPNFVTFGPPCSLRMTRKKSK